MDEENQGDGVSVIDGVTFDPDTRQIGGPELRVVGQVEPKQGPSWWPWAVAAGVLGVLWWLTREDRYHGPLVGGPG